MKRPISLWIFAIGAIITDLLSGAILFGMLIMPAQAFFWNQFVAGASLLLLLFVSSVIGLFKLKKWGRNIFVSLTLIIDCILIWFFAEISLLLSIILITFILSFIVYFLHPSVRKLFK